MLQAPTNHAFQKRLDKDLNITPREFLNNKTLVMQVGCVFTISAQVLL